MRRILDARWWTEDAVTADSLRRLTDLAKISKCDALWVPSDKYNEAVLFIAGSASKGCGIAYHGVHLHPARRDVDEYEFVTIPDHVPDWADKVEQVSQTRPRFFTDKEAPDSYVATLIDIMGLPTDTTRVGVLAELERREAARADRLSPTTSAPVDDRDEIYRRLRLANDRAEAALNALESAVGVIRMLRGGDDV